MPSGLTWRMVDDETDTFEAFAWRCASQFFYDCSRAPDEVKPRDSYYADSLVRDRLELKTLIAYTLEDGRRLAAAEREASITSARESLALAEKVYARVSRIAARVDEWKPPTQIHEDGLKRIMREQISALMDYEANVGRARERLAEAESAPEVPGGQWILARSLRCEESIRGAKKHLADEEKNRADTNEWLRLLRESIPRPADEWGTKK